MIRAVDTSELVADQQAEASPPREIRVRVLRQDAQADRDIAKVMFPRTADDDRRGVHAWAGGWKPGEGLAVCCDVWAVGSDSLKGKLREVVTATGMLDGDADNRSTGVEIDQKIFGDLAGLS